MPTSKKQQFTAILIAALLGTVTAFTQDTPQLNQNFQIEPFELPDGPSGNSINCTVQGPSGFLWFGGHTGLYRYDGSHIKTYKNDPTDSTSIPFSYIEWLFWSSDDYLWIGTFGGSLIRFNPKDESFVHYQHNPKDSTSLSNSRVTAIVEENPTTLWVGTTNGLNRLDRTTGKFEQFHANENDPNSLSYNDIRALYIDRQGTLWVGTGFVYSQNGLGGLNQFHPTTKTFTQYLHNPNDPNTLAGNVIKAIYEDSQGNFWVGGMGGLHLMNREAGTFKRLVDDPTIANDIFAPGFVADEPGNMVHAILEDFNQHLWVFSLHGAAYLGSIASVNLKTNQMEIIQERTPPIAWQVTQCKDGSIWMAGAGVGRQVHKISPTNTQFKYLAAVDSDHGTPHNIVFEGLVNHEDWGIAGKSTNPITEQPMMHNLNPAYGGYRDYPNFELKVHSSQVTTIFNKGIGLVTHGSDVWGCTGSNASGLFINAPLQPEATQILHDPTTPNSPPTNIIYKIIKDQQGDFWTANRGSVSKINPATRTFTNFLPDANDSTSVSPSVMLDLFEDQDGYIWVGGIDTTNSMPVLERINSKTGVVDHAKIPDDLMGPPIYAVSQNRQGDIYFLIISRGLYVLKKAAIESGEWQQNATIAPIKHAALMRANNLIADNEGKLWLTNTAGSVIRYDTENNTFVEFDDKKSGTFLGKVAFKLKDGTIYFSSMSQGLIAINPSSSSNMLMDKATTQVRFTEFQLNGKNVPISKSGKPIWETPQLNLSYQENTLGFRFSAFDFRNPKNSQYQVRLLPVETDWRRITGEPMVNFYGLIPGNYTLEVKGSDSNGIWAEEVAKMQINIAPPWWKTWWAYGLYGLTFFFILYYLRRVELQKQEQKLQFEKEQREKEQAANEQLRKINVATQKFVPNAFLRSLGKDNITDVVLGDHAEQKVTVSFADIRNYTTLSEQMTSEENFRFVSAFNSRMSPAIHRHEGFINQYLGDAIMAIFPKQPSDALAAAIEMQHLLADYNQSRQAKGKSVLRMGIGLHSGSLVMGIIGDEQRMDAATISDTVNVASRVEGLTKHFGANILLSEAVVENLVNQDVFNLRYLGLVQVKGKRAVIKLYECFDGDLKELFALKKATLEDFEKGIHFYYQKDFKTALSFFEKVIHQHPQDRVAQFFIAKIRHLMQRPVPDNWAGVELMERK